MQRNQAFVLPLCAEAGAREWTATGCIFNCLMCLSFGLFQAELFVWPISKVTKGLQTRAAAASSEVPAVVQR